MKLNEVHEDTGRRRNPVNPDIPTIRYQHAISWNSPINVTLYILLHAQI